MDNFFKDISSQGNSNSESSNPFKFQDPFYSASYREERGKTDFFQPEISDKTIDALANTFYKSTSIRSLSHNEIKTIWFLTAYALFSEKKCDAEHIKIQMGHVALRRYNSFERTIFSIVDAISNISCEKILPYLDNLNSIFPGLLEENFRDDNAKQNSDIFFEEVILASASKPEWASVYKSDEKLDEWIKDTTNLISNVILENFDYNDLKAEQIGIILSTVYNCINEYNLSLSKKYNSEIEHSGNGMKTICGILINGLCHIRDGIVSNICLNILKKINPEKQNELFDQLKKFNELKVRTYNLPKGEEYTYINAYVHQILHYRTNIIKLLSEAKDFLELETLLPKLENYEEKLLKSEYLKHFPTPPSYSRESLTPVGEIVFFLDPCFSPLKLIHFNGRLHYTQFIFENENNKNSIASIITGNVTKNCFDKKYMSSVYDVYLDSNERIHSVYNNRFASKPSEEWYQKLNNIILRIDKIFRKVIFQEWQKNPSLYANLYKKNTLIYFFLGEEIFTATDDTFNEECFENREIINVRFPDSLSSFLNHFFHNGCIYSQSSDFESIKNCDNNENNILKDIILNPEEKAWEEISKYLPPNGKITWDWLNKYLSKLGELKFNKGDGKGSHSKLTIEGFNGAYILSKDFRKLLNDTGCDSSILRSMLKSIIVGDHPLETFANALKERKKI